MNSQCVDMHLPATITLTRLSPRLLDCDDNLPMAFKWVRDEIGACFFPDKVVRYVARNGAVKTNKGHADADPRLTWVYKQEKRKIPGIRIEIEF